MIIKPKIGRSRIYDKMHYYTVYGLMGLTLFGLATSGYRIFNVFRSGPDPPPAIEEAKPDTELLKDG